MSRCLVTGGTGYIASHLIKQLLEHPKIESIVTSIRSASKASFLKEFPNADKKLTFLEADIETPGAFDEATKNVDVVFHLASPFRVNVTDPQRDLVDPAVNGTVNVLKSCAISGAVKKVILTSSMASITDCPESDKVFTEADWNNISSLQRNPYYYSKKRAEEEAWKFVESTEGKNLKLVVINPFLVLGPAFTNSVSESVKTFVFDLLNGALPALMDFGVGIVDVRDVAKAHILAWEKDNANGRYLCVDKYMHIKEVADVIREMLPNNGVPKIMLPSWLVVNVVSLFQPKGSRDFLKSNVGKGKYCFSNEKIKKDLEIEFIDCKKTIEDTVNDLIKWKHVVKK